MKGFWRRLLPLSLLLLLTGCGKEEISALNPQGPVAKKLFNLIGYSFGIMVFVIVVVVIIYVIVLIRFRERPGDTHIPEQVHGNKILEIVWTTIPIILVLLLAVPNVLATFELAEKEESEDTLSIIVHARQYWWEFEYPEYGFSAGQDMYIPTNTRVNLTLKSHDVIHSFWVPSLAGKQDNVPGIENDMYIEAPKEGVYQGRCTELCGEGHWLMDFKVIAVDPDTFETWAANMAKAEEGEQFFTETEVTVEGREVFEQNCIQCHSVSGEGNRIGPNLTNFGEREVVAGFLEFNDENIEAFIRDPQGVKPGNKMQAFPNLSDDEMDALIEYLKSLKVLNVD